MLQPWINVQTEYLEITLEFVEAYDKGKTKVIIVTESFVEWINKWRKFSHNFFLFLKSGYCHVTMQAESLFAF